MGGSVSLINGHIDDDVMTDEEIVKALDGADVFLRNRANAVPASLNEYDIEVLLDIAKVCDEAVNLINRQNAEIERLNRILNTDVVVFRGGRGNGKSETIRKIIEARVAEIRAKAYKEAFGDDALQYISTDDHVDRLIDKLLDAISEVGDAGGWYRHDGIEVKIEVEYVPEDK